MTSEYVTLGHPDRIADYISEYILDRYIEQDKFARYALEVQVKDNIVTLAGEITSTVDFSHDDYVDFVKSAIREIGYTDAYSDKWGDGNCIDPRKVEVHTHISKQSPQIAQGVDNLGWGDQGIFWGMAVNEPSTNFMPYDHWLARKIGDGLYECARYVCANWGLDIKVQVSMVDGCVKKVIVAIPLMDSEVELPRVRAEVKRLVGTSEFELIVNGTGSYVCHSSMGDCGTTGRKLAVDFYGGNCRIGGGCVDSETEYISPDGWKKISDYDGGLVGQIDNDMNLSFVKPNDYIKTFHTNVYEIKTLHTLNMVLSDNHNVLYRTSKGHFIKKPLIDILNKNMTNAGGFHGDIPRYFKYSFNEFDNWNNEYMVRFIVAHCADGTKLDNKNFNGRIRVKKQHKINLLREYLPKTGIAWEERDYNDGFKYFYYNIPNNDKNLYNHFKHPSMKTASILCDEVFKWDGSVKDMEYRTTNKIDADFIQFVLSGMTGNPWSLITHKKMNNRESTLYVVRNNTYLYSSPFRKNKTSTIRKVTPRDMYCFSVPSGLLLLRCNNYVFVTGNSPWTKDPTKADLTLNLYARKLALEYLKSNNLDECHVQIECCIGRKDITIQYYDGHMNLLETSYENKPNNEIIDELGLRSNVYSKLARNGLFSFII